MPSTVGAGSFSKNVRGFEHRSREAGKAPRHDPKGKRQKGKPLPAGALTSSRESAPAAASRPSSRSKNARNVPIMVARIDVFDATVLVELPRPFFLVEIEFRAGIPALQHFLAAGCETVRDEFDGHVLRSVQCRRRRRSSSVAVMRFPVLDGHDRRDHQGPPGSRPSNASRRNPASRAGTGDVPPSNCRETGSALTLARQRVRPAVREAQQRLDRVEFAHPPQPRRTAGRLRAEPPDAFREAARQVFDAQRVGVTGHLETRLRPVRAARRRRGCRGWRAGWRRRAPPAARSDCPQDNNIGNAPDTPPRGGTASRPTAGWVATGTLRRAR